ncbi:SDR family oxidoreductase [Parachlamydia sp. AcF125]|uniref:SDR family oxidoreductase n=1 Tax=Parachlamydia sp. AcF125 TaxID=2795736 RepID=UPI001BC91085|nr:SDR family oxidoreductase [Parachlamydia sp. AcF125]MBS4169182.1 Protein YeeZ [Parachlamydia sp. AcF125]
MSVKLKIGILGCGYVGKAVAQSLKPHHEVTAFTRRVNRLEELATYANKVMVIEKTLDSLLENQQILIITIAPSQGDSYEECYLKTAQAIASCIAKCPNLRQIIYTSSTSVYGEYCGAWVDENTIPNPQNEKEQVLLQAEKVLLSLTSKTPSVCILRLGEIFGPGRELTRRFAGNGRKIFPGTGENFTNLTHLADIINVITFAINNALQGIYNLCLDIHPTRKLLYKQLCRRNHFPDPFWDTQAQTIHAGNKKVLCGKLRLAGYSLPFQGLA